MMLTIGLLHWSALMGLDAEGGQLAFAVQLLARALHSIKVNKWAGYFNTRILSFATGAHVGLTELLADRYGCGRSHS